MAGQRPAPPVDHAPPGTADLAISYDLTFDTPPDNTQVFTHLHDYWTSKGYHIVLDQRNNLPTRVFSVENPADGFRIGLTEGSGGELFLNITAPCLHT